MLALINAAVGILSTALAAQNYADGNYTLATLNAGVAVFCFVAALIVGLGS